MNSKTSYVAIPIPYKPINGIRNSRIVPKRRFGFLSRAWSVVLILLLGSFAEISYAINIFEPGFSDSFVSNVDSPGQTVYGNISISDTADLYVTGGRGREVYRIRNESSSPVASSQVLTVGVFVDGNTLVFGDFPTGGDQTRNLYTYDLSTNEFIRPPIDVRSIGGANDIVKAPPGWGNFGGKLIIAGVGSDSRIYAYDPFSGDTTTIAKVPPGSLFTALAFTDDNELIATTYTGKSIVRVRPDGTITPLVSFPGRTEAVEVHKPSGDAFVVTITDDFRGEMYRVNLSTLQATLFADNFAVNNGFFPHPLAFSKDQGTLYYGENETGLYVIRQITGFEKILQRIDGFNNAGPISQFNNRAVRTNLPIGDYRISIDSGAIDLCNTCNITAISFRLGETGPIFDLGVLNIPLELQEQERYWDGVGRSPEEAFNAYLSSGNTFQNVSVQAPTELLIYLIDNLRGDFSFDNSSSLVVKVEELGNQPPVAICQDVSVLTEPGVCSADASVDDGSFDPDEGEITLGQIPFGPYGLGDTDVTLTVTDDKGASESCGATVTVVDQEAPVISLVSAYPNVLWPPNHKMVPVVLEGDATDNCESACQIISVSSNESVGKTSPDWIITGDLTVKLRAERFGKGHGREYSITVECTDKSGNSSTATEKVIVPHDKGKKKNKK